MKKIVMWIMKIYGAEWYRLVLFSIKVQQRLSMSRTKDSTNQDGDDSLQGLDIDWHLANAEMGFDNFIAPIQDAQPTYAYA